MKPLPLRWRLTGWFVSGFGLLLAAGALGLHAWLARSYRTQFDAELNRSVAAFRELHRQEREYFADDWSAAEHAVQELLFEDRVFVALRDDGTVMTSRGLDLVDRLVPQLPAHAGDTLFDVTAGDVPFRVAHRSLGSDVSAFVVLSRAPLDQRLVRLRAALAGGLPLVLVLGGLLGAAGARRALRPVGRVAAAAGVVAREVHEGRDEFTRLPPAPVGDELGLLTGAMNELVDRLGPALRKERALVEAQRDFLASAAHELRMPVTILRSEAEVALEGSRDPAAYRDALRRIADEAEELSTLVNDLLLLARADSVTSTLQPERVFMDDLAARALRRVGRHPAARGRELRLEDFEPAPVRGDPSLLERALGVLVHNALVHAAPSDVVVRAGCDGDTSWVEVVDDGPGIPPEAAERVFERFVRLDGSTPGTGLGLPIARWIAELHGGTLTLESQPGAGSRFTLRLPAG
ncbi:MAG: HAMP domain-containing sensor histidine kinase [Longimicrobiales bacterium]